MLLARGGEQGQRQLMHPRICTPHAWPPVLPPARPARPAAGVLYSATIVPLPVSVAVINMGLTEAKVECLFSEFVQLRWGSSCGRGWAARFAPLC